MRSRLYLRRELDDSGDEPDRNIRVLEVKKANYGVVGEHMRLRWKNGVFVPDDNRHRSTLSNIDTRIIDEVRRTFDDGKPWSQHTQAKSR